MEVRGLGPSGGTIVDGQRAQHGTVIAQDRLGPAGPQPVPERRFPVALPQGVGGDVGDVDRLPANAAVPHEPAAGPIGTPSIAMLYASGRLGAAPCRSRPPSARRIKASTPNPDYSSISRHRTASTSGSAAPGRSIRGPAAAPGAAPTPAASPSRLVRPPGGWTRRPEPPAGRAAGQPRHPARMPGRERDPEAIRGRVRQPLHGICPGIMVFPLLAVRDHGRAGGLEARDRVPDRLIVERSQSGGRRRLSSRAPPAVAAASGCCRSARSGSSSV